MSGVNISILEGGKAENFGQVTKLRTSNGTDHDSWVPKGDVETKHLSVKKNGLHYTNQYEPTASEKKDGKFHDVYGWDTITVSVKKKVKGKKRKTSPSTGIEYDAPTSVDVDDDGNLIETELPVSIEIEVPPSKLQYYDGDSISKAGMVVKAYYADDSEWGTVPLDEITLEPTTASGEGSDEYSDGDGVNAKRIDFVYRHWHWYDSMLHKWREHELYVYPPALGTKRGTPVTVGWNASDGGAGAQYVTRYNGEVYSKNISGCGNFNLYEMFPEDEEYIALDGSGMIYEGSGSTTAQTYTDKFYRMSWGEYLTNIPESTKDPTRAGELYPSAQSITVKWTPPEGEDELTDTFDITVIPHNNNGGGGR